MNSAFKSGFTKTASLGSFIGEISGYGKYKSGKNALQKAEQLYKEQQHFYRESVKVLEDTKKYLKGETKRRLDLFSDSAKAYNKLPAYLRREMPEAQKKNLMDDVINMSHKDIQSNVRDLRRTIRSFNSDLESYTKSYSKDSEEAKNLINEGRNRMIGTGLLTGAGAGLLGTGIFKYKKRLADKKRTSNGIS